MTLAEAVGETAARGVAVAGLATLTALPLRRLMARTQGTPRWLLWPCLLAVLLTPALVIGYAYPVFIGRAAGALSLDPLGLGALRRTAYAALLWLRLTAAAALVLHLLPAAPVSAAALHAHRLLRASAAVSKPRWLAHHAALLLRGPLRAPLVAFTLAFLLAFQEFELASLLTVDAWSVWLFDAQVGGLPLGRTLRFALLPLALQLALLVPVFLLLRGRGGEEGDAAPPPALPAWAAAVAWAFVALAVLAVCAAPLLYLVAGAWRSGGGDGGPGGFGIGGQIMASVFFAGGAALAAGGAALMLSRRGGRSRAAAAVALVLAGLLGPLAVALVVMQSFQWPVLRWARETPLPLLLALTLILLPLAIVLAALLRRRMAAEAHLGRLTRAAADGGVRRRGGEMVWRLHARPRVWLVLLLFAWAYFELAASSLLAPVTMPTAPARLYNLMHYGQSTALTANVLLTVAAAAAVLAAGALAARLWPR